jgi:phosphocarrier protein HPr
LVRKEVIVKNQLGLHARPASTVVKTASRFDCEVKLNKDDMTVNAKSIMGVLILAAEKGSTVCIITEGIDENQALEAIVTLFEDGFGE